MNLPHRIDVHQHVVPPFWAKELSTHGGDPSGPRSGELARIVRHLDGRKLYGINGSLS
jgi:hypothetical protein